MDGRRPVRLLTPATRLVATLLALTCCGCVSGNWVRESADEPLTLAALSEVEIHSSSLQDVLDLFGAPLSVWENDNTAVAVAYGWYESNAYNVTVSYQVTKGNSADFDYDRSSAQMNGVVFIFDDSLTLRSWRAGRLADILGESARVRPTLPPRS